MTGGGSTCCEKRNRSVSPPKTRHYEKPTIESLNKQHFRPCKEVSVKVTVRTPTEHPLPLRSPRLCEETQYTKDLKSLSSPNNQYDTESTEEEQDQAQYLGEDSSTGEWDEEDIPKKRTLYERDYHPSNYVSMFSKDNFENIETGPACNNEQKRAYNAYDHTDNLLSWVNVLKESIERIKNIHDTAHVQVKNGIFPKPPSGDRRMNPKRKDRIKRSEEPSLYEELLSLQQNAEVIEKTAKVIRKRLLEEAARDLEDKRIIKCRNCESLRKELEEARNEVNEEKTKGQECLLTLLQTKINEYGNLTAAFEKVTQENKELSEKNGNLEADFHFKNNELLYLEKELQEKAEESENIIKRLNTELKNRGKEYDTKIAELQTKTINSTQEVKKLKEQTGKLLKENKELKSLETDLQTRNAKISRLEQEVNKYKNIASKVQKKSTDALNYFQERTVSKDLVKAKTTVRNLQNQVKQLETKCKTYEEKDKMKILEIRDKTRDMEKLLSESPRRIKQQEEKHAKEMLLKEEEIQCWKRKYEESCLQMKEQVKEVEGYANELQKRETEYTVLQQKYNRMNAQVKEVEGYANELQKRKTEYTVLQQKYNRLKDEQEESKRELQIIDAENARLKSEINRLKDQGKDTEWFRSELQRKKAEYKVLQSEYNRLSDVQERISDLAAQLESSKRDYVMLHNEFDSVNSRLQEEKSKNAAGLHAQQILQKDEVTRATTLIEEELVCLQRELQNEKQIVFNLEGEIQKGKRREEQANLESRKRSEELLKLQRENGNMGKECKSLRERIITLEKTSQNLLDKNTRVMEEYSKMEEKLSSQIEINADDKRKLQKMQTLNELLAGNEESVRDAERKIKEKEQTIHLIEDELKQVKYDLKRTNEQSEAIKKERNYEQMLKEEKTLEMSREIEKYEQQQWEWKSALSTKDKEIEDLTKQLVRTKEQLEKSKKERNDVHMLTTLEMSREKFKVDQQQREWLTDLSTKDKVIEDLTKQLDRTNEQLAQTKQEKNLLTKEKTLEISKEKVKVEKQQRELESALSTKEKEIENLTKQLARMKTLSESLARNEEKFRDAETKIKEKEQTIHFLENELKQVKNDLKRTNEQLKGLKQERNYEQILAEEKNMEMSNEKDKVEQLQREWKSALSTKDKEIENLTMQLIRTNEQLKTIKEERYKEQILTKERNLERSQEKDNVEQQQREWKSALSTKDKEIENLTKQLESSKKKVSTMMKNMEDTEERSSQNIEKLKRENTSLHENLISLKSRIDDQEVKITKAKENNEEQQRNIEKLEKENYSLCRQLEKLNERLIETEDNLDHFKKERISTGENYRSMENKIKEKNSLIITLEERLKRSEAKHETLMVAIDEERNRVLLTEEKRKQDDNVITSLQSRLEELRTGYNKIKTEKDNTEKKYLDLLREIKSKEREIDSFNKQVERLDELSKECNDLRRDKQNIDNKVNRMSKHIQEKEKEAEALVEKLARSEEKVALLSNEIRNLQQTEKRGKEESIQKLQRENISLKTELDRVTAKAQEQIAVLNKEIKNLQKAKGLDSEESTKKLHRENTNLKSELERVSSSLDQLRRDYTEVKREKDHALNRLSSVAGEKLRDNNPGIADLSDENRPINLGEKFSQLYDDQWTDAMENLEENLRFGETEGIQCLLSILKRIFDECVRISDDQFSQLKEITGTTNLPSDQLKKLKDLRKSTALQSVKNVKQLVNKVMLTVFSKEKDGCQSYIDRCTELCWLMCVQDPPVVIDFTAVRGQVVDDKMLRKFTKTGSKIDFLVWPMIRLHKNGPLLQKGVVQPL